MGLNSAALPEIGKVVNIIPASHAAAVVGDVVSLKNYHKAYFIFQYNGSGAANTVSVHLYGGATVAGIVAANLTLYNWWVLNATTAGMLLTDTLTKGAVGTVAVVTSVANQDMLLVIEVDPADYEALGYDCFTIQTDASNAANWQNCIAVLVPGRYQQATPPSAIID